MADLRSYTDFYADNDNFTVPQPELGSYMAAFGPASGGSPTDTLTRATVQASLSATVLATVQTNEPGYITMVHRPTVYRVAGRLQGRTVGLIGNHIGEIIPRIFANTAFEIIAGVNTLTHAALRVSLNAGALRVGPYPDGTHADAVAVDVRRAIVLPSEWAAKAVEKISWTTMEFYDEFLAPEIGAQTKPRSLNGSIGGWWPAPHPSLPP